MRATNNACAYGVAINSSYINCPVFLHELFSLFACNIGAYKNGFGPILVEKTNPLLSFSVGLLICTPTMSKKGNGTNFVFSLTLACWCLHESTNVHVKFYFFRSQFC